MTQPAKPDVPEWYRIEVSDKDGQIVAIEPEMLAGRDIGEIETAAILNAIQHLSGFIGEPHLLRDEIDALRRHIEQMEGEIETLRMQLAGCGVAAMANTEHTRAQRIGRDNPYWSASYGDVCDAVDREMALRADAERYRWLRQPRNHFGIMTSNRWSTAEQFDAIVDAAIDAAMGLDSKLRTTLRNMADDELRQSVKRGVPQEPLNNQQGGREREEEEDTRVETRSPAAGNGGGPTFKDAIAAIEKRDYDLAADIARGLPAEEAEDILFKIEKRRAA